MRTVSEMTDRTAGLRAALGGWRTPLTIASVTTAAMLILPLVVIVGSSLTAGNYIAFPPEGVSLRWYSEVFHSREWTDSLMSSLRITAVGALLATITGSSAAFALRRLRHGARWLRSLFIVPLFVPWIAYALGLYRVMDSVGGVGSAWAVAVGQATLAFAIVFVIVSAGLAAVPSDVYRAAASLGARWPTIAFRVEFPLVRRSIAAAALFAIATCFDDVIIALYLTSPENKTLPVQIWNETFDSVSPTISAAGTLMMAGAIAALALGTWLVRPAVKQTPVAVTSAASATSTRDT